MFKLIALRPLEGCRESALKCLKKGQLYYFCNDYTITKDGICYRDEYVKPLPDDFFSLYGNSKLQVNVSAIVGMNGDGKSTLVELMMRLINNCAKHYNLTYKDNLLKIEMIKAELFFELDNVVYCIREEESDNYTSLLKYADVSDRGVRKWKKLMTPVKSVNQLKELFYTIVSNYSLYAYNTNDFREEWNESLKVKEDSEKCWLHYLFHKNDGYLTPMTIHPYRDEGNMEVNRETELTMQRLMALYIQEPSPNENEHSFRRIGGKDAEILCLADVGSSKLQQQTIIQFFKDTKSISILSKYIQILEENIKKFDEIVVERLNNLEVVETSLELITGWNDKAYQDYLNVFVDWISKKRGVYSSRSDIRLLLFAMQKFNNNVEYARLPYDRFLKKFKRYDKLNVKQLTRLRFIYQVMKLWGYSTDIILKDYNELTDIEKCQHYIVYKTIDICATYPKYSEMLDSGDEGWNNQSLVLREDVIWSVVEEIKKDKSHITLKLKQCLNYIDKRIDAKENFYEILDDNKLPQQLREKHNGCLMLRFDDLKNYYNIDPFPLDLLPPPIFNTDILYQRSNQENEYMPYRFLSSGEKQLLNNLGALIYHLRNLDSVETDGKRYENINIMLEEIELYFHPDYQRMIVKLLLEKIQAIAFKSIKRINVTFVTHSPFILSDIPLCNVLFLREGRPAVGSMQENTFGSNIHGMLRNGFFLPSLPIGEFAHEKINMLFERLNGFKLNPNDKEQAEWFYSNIMRVGEPYLREQLMKLYNMHFRVNER